MSKLAQIPPVQISDIPIIQVIAEREFRGGNSSGENVHGQTEGHLELVASGTATGVILVRVLRLSSFSDSIETYPRLDILAGYSLEVCRRLIGGVVADGQRDRKSAGVNLIYRGVRRLFARTKFRSALVPTWLGTELHQHWARYGRVAIK